MKNLLITLGLLLTLLIAMEFSFAGQWEIDKEHSQIGFTVGHLVGKVSGVFTDFSGSFAFDGKKPETAKGGTITVKTASIDTNNGKRDEHLRAVDFFDVGKFPEMTAENAVLTVSEKNKYKLKTDLTIKGVRKPVVFDVEYSGSAKDPWGNLRAGFTAKTKLNRKDFGMSWNKTLDNGGLLVGNDVDVTILIEAVAKK